MTSQYNKNNGMSSVHALIFKSGNTIGFLAHIWYAFTTKTEVLI